MTQAMLSPIQIERGRIYYLRLFDGDLPLPQNRFLRADNEEQALSQARSIMPWLTREVWDGRRLVRVLAPASEGRDHA